MNLLRYKVALPWPPCFIGALVPEAPSDPAVRARPSSLSNSGASLISAA